jgi:hypothetical protein
MLLIILGRAGEAGDHVFVGLAGGELAGPVKGPVKGDKKYLSTTGGRFGIPERRDQRVTAPPWPPNMAAMRRPARHRARTPASATRHTTTTPFTDEGEVGSVDTGTRLPIHKSKAGEALSTTDSAVTNIEDADDNFRAIDKVPAPVTLTR